MVVEGDAKVYPKTLLDATLADLGRWACVQAAWRMLRPQAELPAVFSGRRGSGESYSLSRPKAKLQEG